MLSTGPGALILAHCVARALPSRPILVYATKGFTGQGRRVRLPDEFTRFVRKGSKVLIVEDLITTGETIRLLIQMVEAGGRHRSSGSAASGSARRRSTWGRTSSAW